MTDLDLTCIFQQFQGALSVKKLLGSGNQGFVYEACYQDNCDYVLKIISDPESSVERESQINSVASKLGTSPHIYNYGSCKDSSNRDVRWILMQKINGVTLIEYVDRYGYEYFQKSNMIDDILDRYYLLVQNQIYQHDLQAKNIMITSDNLYLIDFGLAQIVPGLDIGTIMIHMTVVAGFLVRSLTYISDTEEPDKISSWGSYSEAQKFEIFKTLMEKVKLWFLKTFRISLVPNTYASFPSREIWSDWFRENKIYMTDRQYNSIFSIISNLGENTYFFVLSLYDEEDQTDPNLETNVPTNITRDPNFYFDYFTQTLKDLGYEVEIDIPNEIFIARLKLA